MKRFVVVLLIVMLLIGCTPQGKVTHDTTTTVPMADTAAVTTTITEGKTMTTTDTEAQTTATVPMPSNSATTKMKTTKGTTVTVKTVQSLTTTAATTASNGITLLEPQDGYLVESQYPLVREYLEIDTEKEAAEFWIASYTGMAHSASFTAQWKSKGNFFQFYLSQDPSFENARKILTTTCRLKIANLLPGQTYYWKVVNMYGVSSEVRCVTVEDTNVRWIEARGGDNIRDLGGWKTESGKTVRYELLYRGACVDGYKGAPELTQEGKETLRKQLGIRTQLDLRGSDVQSTTGAFGAVYMKKTMTQYDYVYKSAQSKQSLGEIFALLSDEANYPVYFHCNAGADRTGTLAFFINGLLGVSYADLTRDFELTGFSSRGKRLRSALDMDTLMFDPSGVMKQDSSNYIAWGPLYNKMMTNYGTGSGKLSDAIAHFLKKDCGVTQEQIDAVRRIMLK